MYILHDALECQLRNINNKTVVMKTTIQKCKSNIFVMVNELSIDGKRNKKSENNSSTQLLHIKIKTGYREDHEKQ